MERKLSVVLLENWVTPDMGAVAEAIRSRHPGTAVEVLGGDSSSPMISCGGIFVVVMSMPAQLPNDEGVLVRAAATWPNVRETFQRHQAHLVVATMEESVEPLPAARSLTAVLGGLIAVVPGCLGVVWGERVAQPAERWLEMSTKAFAPYPDFPFTLWIGIHPFREGAQFCAVTSGLSWFIDREIELEGSPDQPTLINRIAGLSAYLIERGDVIEDDPARFKVQREASQRFAGLPVLRVSALPA